MTTVEDPRWLEVSPPLAIDDDDAPLNPPDEAADDGPPNVPPPDFTPEETPEQGSQD